MNGASTANGAIVMSRNSATLPRAWSTEVLKKIVPASDTATNASPTLPAAVSSMSLSRPVRPAPEAPVSRWMTRAVPRVADLPARAAAPVAEAAPRAASCAPDIRMLSVFRVSRPATTGRGFASPRAMTPAGVPGSPRHREQWLDVSPATRTREPDALCAQAVDLARAAAAEVAGAGQVGEHLAAEADGDRVVTHLFVSLLPGYVGWRWAVTVARASRSKQVTVSEVVLLPGPDALLAPEWVPWRDRLRPGDLGVGDLLPAPPDDERLVPVVAGEGDDGLLGWPEEPGAEAAAEAGTRQGRVLSAFGRDTTA